MTSIKKIIEQEAADRAPGWCYISGPYTNGDPVENTRAMCLEWSRLQNKYPEVVFINPLAGSFSQHFANPEPYDFWIEYDLALIRLLARSGPGLVYRFRPHSPSAGADLELGLADRLGVTVLRGGSIDCHLDEVLGRKPRIQHVRGEVEEDAEVVTIAVEPTETHREKLKRHAAEMLPNGRRYTHPMQSVEVDDDGTERFVGNKIVQYLVQFARKHGHDLNFLTTNTPELGFSIDDWRQLAQLNGYSLGGFEELTYVGICYEEKMVDGFDQYAEELLCIVREELGKMIDPAVAAVAFRNAECRHEWSHEIIAGRQIYEKCSKCGTRR